MPKKNKKYIAMGLDEYFPNLMKYIKQNEILSITKEEKTREVFTDNGEIKEVLDGTEIITIEIYNEEKDMTK